MACDTAEPVEATLSAGGVSSTAARCGSSRVVNTGLAKKRVMGARASMVVGGKQLTRLSLLAQTSSRVNLAWSSGNGRASPSLLPPTMPQQLNTLASPEQVECTPSRRDGIPAELEEELRVYGCQLIQQAGILLDL